MLVYMFLNTVTQKVYVGATDKTLDDRWKSHLKSAAGGSNYRFHRALREWPEEVWLQVVLANCYSIEELSSAETWWIATTAASDDGVGYNSPASCPYATSVANGRKSAAPKLPKKQSPLKDLTPEQRSEWFREQGKKGGAHGSKGARPRAEMTEAEREKYREWGRKGAQRSKELKGQT